MKGTPMSRTSGLALLAMLLLGACAGGSAEPGATAGDPLAAQRGARDSDNRVAKGRMLLMTDPAGAAKLLSAAIASSPNDPVALGDLGIAFDLLGKHADAQVAYRHALAVKPNLRAARVNLALSLALDGHADGALDAIGVLGASAATSPVESADVAAVHALAGR